MAVKMITDADLPKEVIKKRNVIKQKEELQGNRKVLIRNYSFQQSTTLDALVVEMTINTLEMPDDYVIISSIVMPIGVQDTFIRQLSLKGLQQRTSNISQDAKTALHLLLISDSALRKFEFVNIKELAYADTLTPSVSTAITRVESFLKDWNHLMYCKRSEIVAMRTLRDFKRDFISLLTHLLPNVPKGCSDISTLKMAYDEGIVNWLVHDAMLDLISCVDLRSDGICLIKLHDLSIICTSLAAMLNALRCWVDYVKKNGIGDYKVSAELARVSYQLKNSDEIIGNEAPVPVAIKRLKLLSMVLVNVLYENSNHGNVSTLEAKVMYLQKANLLPIGTIERLRDLLFFENSRECRYTDLFNFVSLLHDQVKEVLMDKIATESEVVKSLDEYKTELENLLKEIKKHYEVAVCNLDDNESLSFVKEITDSGYGTLYINTVY